VLSFSGMPYDEADRNMRLFASDVMPRLKAMNVTPAGFSQAPIAATA